MFTRPHTPKASAMRRATLAISSCTFADSEKGGRQQAESPEWMPAISMCSRMPPMYTSSPSLSASRSHSTAPSRNLSRYTGWSGETAVASAT